MPASMAATSPAMSSGIGVSKCSASPVTGCAKPTGGNREHVPVIASAAVAVGVAGVFLEVHDDPDNAASDGPNNLHLDALQDLLIKLKQFDSISKNDGHRK